MKILIGCPVYQRAWILPLWFEAIEKQTIPLNELGFIFELGPDDDETHDYLWNWHMAHPEVECFDAVVREDVKHKTHPDNQRTWSKLAYYKMVDLRNSLLDRVTCIAPEAYFSLDSDLILEDPQSLEKLFHTLKRDGIDAVSPLSYMYHKGTQFPSVMSWIDGVGKRAARVHDDYLLGSTFSADVIMAAVMMSPNVYNNVRYVWHPQGEDLGWSAECTRKGYSLYCVSDIYVPHIMHRWMLDDYLKNGDPRKMLSRAL